MTHEIASASRGSLAMTKQRRRTPRSVPTSFIIKSERRCSADTLVCAWYNGLPPSAVIDKPLKKTKIPQKEEHLFWLIIVGIILIINIWGLWYIFWIQVVDDITFKYLTYHREEARELQRLSLQSLNGEISYEEAQRICLKRYMKKVSLSMLRGMYIRGPQQNT
jgi:hypothetical protein